jgi:hypothetical protein
MLEYAVGGGEVLYAKPTSGDEDLTSLHAHPSSDNVTVFSPLRLPLSS